MYSTRSHDRTTSGARSAIGLKSRRRSRACSPRQASASPARWSARATGGCPGLPKGLPLRIAVESESWLRVRSRLSGRLIRSRPPNPTKRSSGANLVGLPHSLWVRSSAELDQIVVWHRPKQKPRWMTAKQFADLPAEITVRELRYQVTRPGFRVRVVTRSPRCSTPCFIRSRNWPSSITDGDGLR